MMPDCTRCALFELEGGGDACLHVNRPGGLALTRRLLAHCAPPPGGRVLEAAAGAGATLELLRSEYRLRAVGLDLSFAMLRRARARWAHQPLMLADAGRIPLAVASQDVILAECALSMLGEAAPGEFARLLGIGGRLGLSDVYLRTGEVNGCLNGSCLAGALPEAHIRARLAQAGLRVAVWEDCTPLFTSWAAEIVFRLGSREAFYRAITGSAEAARRLCGAGDGRLRFGYYLLVAEKCA